MKLFRFISKCLLDNYFKLKLRLNGIKTTQIVATYKDRDTRDSVWAGLRKFIKSVDDGVIYAPVSDESMVILSLPTMKLHIRLLAIIVQAGYTKLHILGYNKHGTKIFDEFMED